MPAVEGSDPCWEPGCDAANGVQCSYVDSRMQRCQLMVCPDHQMALGEKAYCRRHAGTLNAIFGNSGEAQDGGFEKRFLPDINSRAASLANWVGRDLDGDIHGVLQELMAEMGGDIRVEPVHERFINRPGGRVRRWEREWKLFDSTGVLMRITVGVDESTDKEVVVAVDSSEVDRAVPPWIANRGQEAGDDASVRAQFYAELKDAIRKGVEHSRSFAG